MKEYDLYLPLSQNDGRPIAEETIAGIKQAIVHEFGGLTYFPQENEGLWKFGGATFRDKIVILRVLGGDAERARRFFEGFTPELKRRLGQASILLVEREVQMLG